MLNTFYKFIFFINLFLIFNIYTKKLFAIPQNKGNLSSVYIGTNNSALKDFRGVITYNQIQIEPFIVLFFLDDHLQFLDDSISYNDFLLKDFLRLRTRIDYIYDTPIFPVNDDLLNKLPHRKNSFEWINSIELFFPSYSNYLAELDLNFAKDINVTWGSYIELVFKIKLFEFKILKIVEPNFFFSVGWGDSRNNSYWYGNDDKKSGFNNFSSGIILNLPEDYDRSFPFLGLYYFETIGEHKFKEYSTGRNKGWNLNFGLAIDFLDTIKYKRK